MTSDPDLAELGWTPFFADQLDGDTSADAVPARVMAVHRGYLTVVGPGVDRMIPAYIADAGDEEAFATAGDWLLLDRATFQPVRILRRKSLFKRRAPGAGRGLQLLAANVDTLFIVTSCNQDFNIPRLERYLVLAHEAGVTPVIVLTKADLTDDPAAFTEPARGLQAGLLVEIVDARDAESAACLGAWCTHGQTVALLGSSGVGKSTLINTLIGHEAAATRDVRESDDKGRHTTTGRGLHRLPYGGWLLDTPGMRELQLAGAAAGVDEFFDDIVTLAAACRFNDCAHESEPGCAVKAAVEAGTLDGDRLQRWRKLSAEEALNTETLAQRRVRDRSLGKVYRSAQRRKRDRDAD
jgi:ribosome biogenesis GTPase